MYSYITQHLKYLQNTPKHSILCERRIKGAQETKTFKTLYRILPNHRDSNSHGTNITTGPRCSAKYGSICGGIFTLQLQTWAIRTGSLQLLHMTRVHQVILIHGLFCKLLSTLLKSQNTVYYRFFHSRKFVSQGYH